jgi:hypothetical protein
VPNKLTDGRASGRSSGCGVARTSLRVFPSSFDTQRFAGLSWRGTTEFDGPFAGVSTNERDCASRAPGNGGGRFGEAGNGGGRRCDTERGSGGGRLGRLGELEPGRFDGPGRALGLRGGLSERVVAPGPGALPLGISALGLAGRAPMLASCGLAGFAASGRGGANFAGIGSRPTRSDGGRRVAAMFAPKGDVEWLNHERRKLDCDAQRLETASSYDRETNTIGANRPRRSVPLPVGRRRILTRPCCTMQRSQGLTLRLLPQVPDASPIRRGATSKLNSPA